MKHFKSPGDIPDRCLIAPTAYFIPRPGKKPIGRIDGSLLFDRNDVSELLPADEWNTRGRKIKAGQKPIAQRGVVDPAAVFADWQME
jgi:hypothetical protein